MPPKWPFPSRTICSFEDLLSIIQALPEVPGRDEGRLRGVRGEAWILARYLAAAVHAGVLVVPLRVLRRESPDIQLELDSGVRGIEITEAIDQNYSEALAVADSHGYISRPEALKFIEDSRSGALSREDAKARVHHIGTNSSLLTPLEGDGFGRRRSVALWTDLLVRRVVDKCDKATRGHYAEFDRTDLLVYDNTMLDVDLKTCMDALVQQLPSGCPFHTLSILTGAIVAVLSPRDGWWTFPKLLEVPSSLIC